MNTSRIILLIVGALALVSSTQARRSINIRDKGASIVENCSSLAQDIAPELFKGWWKSSSFDQDKWIAEKVAQADKLKRMSY